MITYKVVEVLSNLSPKQMMGLNSFLVAMGSECRAQELELFRQLNKLHSKLPITSKELSARSGISPKRLSDITNKLLNHVNDYCILLTLCENDDEIDRMKAHLDFLISHGLAGQYKSALKSYLKELKLKKTFYAPEYLSLYRFYKSLAVHEKLFKGRKISIDIELLSNLLNAYYKLEQLKLACETLSRGRILEIQNYSFNYDQIINDCYIALPRNPLVSIYESMIHIYLKRSPLTIPVYESVYRQVIKLPLERGPHPDIVTVLHLLINLTLAGEKAGIEAFRKKFLEIITYMEDHGILIERNVISSALFKAVVGILLKEGQIRRSKQFIEKYARSLAPGIKESIVAFAKAQIAFYEGNYDEVRTQLHAIFRPTLDVYFLLNIRVMELQLFIEERLKPQRGFSGKRDFDSFERLVRNFKLYLQRKPSKAMKVSSGDKSVISDSRRKATMKFILSLNSIVLNCNNNTALKKIEEEIKSEINISDRFWLLSLLNALLIRN